jgi:hypothetical protein
MNKDSDEMRTGREAPMVITPRALARFARQLTDAGRTAIRAYRRRSPRKR